MADALLEEAAWAGDAAEVARLLSKGGADAHANTDAALQCACAEGHAHVVQLLLDAGAADTHEALCAACAGGHMAVVELLLLAGAADAGARAVPLERASRAGHLAVVDLLLAHGGADVHADDDGALIWASVQGHLAVVDRLLEAGADVHTRTEEPLREACRCGHADVVARLLRAGAKARFLGPESPLWLASASGRLDIVDLLLTSAGVSVVADRGCALFEAARAGHGPVVDRLLGAAGADPLDTLRAQFDWEQEEGFAYYPVLDGLLGQDPGAYTDADDALQYASAVGDLGAVERALLAGAEVDANGGLALRLACWTGRQLAVVERLLSAGANVHARHDSALAQACGGGHLAVVNVLLAAGADARTPHALPWACRAGHVDVVRCLLHAGADVHMHGETALSTAAYGGHLPVVNALLELGADASHVWLHTVHRSSVHVLERLLEAGLPNWSALLDSAVSQGLLDVVNVLVRAGAHADEGSVLAAVHQGHVETVARLLQAGHRGSVRVWREVRKAGLAPRLILAVSRASFAGLPPPVQPLWLRYHVWMKHRLHRRLQRARDRLDRPPHTSEPLGAGTPTRDKLIAHLRTAGRRFAREYWTDGVPLFFKGAELGPVPAEFLFGSEGGMRAGNLE